MIGFFQQYPEYWSDWSARLLLGARITAELSLIGFALALVLGALLVWALLSPNGILRRLAALFIQSMRAVPLLALLLALYFALPSLGLTLSGYWAGPSAWACRAPRTLRKSSVVAWMRCIAASAKPLSPSA